ncbi:MAG: sugar phosphate isomerase/epimerase [Chloroflexi bacterium]|nr:sugar phosphate isomerase/epimerase [Chloroflexota bacterium]
MIYIVLISLSTGCLYHFTLRHTLALAADMGFDGVELVMGPEVWLRGAKYVRKLARETGLRVLSVHPTLLRSSPKGGGAGRIADATEAALVLECPTIVAHGPGTLRWEAPEAQDWLRQVDVSRERLNGNGARLALENPGWYCARDRQTVLAHLPVLQAFAHQHDLDVTLDTCHLGTSDMGLLEGYRLVRGRLANVHFSDLRPRKLRFDCHPVRTLLSHHQMPGDGILPLQAMLADMQGDGYAGPVSMEISPLALQVWSPRQLRANLQRAIECVRSVQTETEMT